MNLVTNPQEVERLAEEREDENWDFRNWIKYKYGFDDPELNGVVQELADEITAQIDCTQCANCCRKTTTQLEPEDIERLSAALGLSVSALRETCLEHDEEFNEWILSAPCPLLEGTLCRVYEARPVSCREYPCLHRDFRAHSISCINSTFICPIVFNVVE